MTVDGQGQLRNGDRWMARDGMMVNGQGQLRNGDRWMARDGMMVNGQGQLQNGDQWMARDRMTVNGQGQLWNGDQWTARDGMTVNGQGQIWDFSLEKGTKAGYDKENRNGDGQIVQAENVTVVEGGTAEINCKLHNYDHSIVVIQNPSRQTLFFNGTRALKDERFQLVTFTQRLVKIVLNDVKVEDEGGYFCQLYTDDTHHQVATLTVLVPPENPLVEVKEQAVEGSEAELTCIVERTKPPATLRWFRDRKEIIGMSRQQENVKTFSVMNTIKLPVTRKDDESIVTCEATHPALERQKKQTQYALNVHYSPTVKIQHPGGVLREGDLFILTCSVKGNPQPAEVIWKRLNDSLPDRVEVQDGTLTIPSLNTWDNGTYICEAENEYGAASDQYVLVVYDPGAIIEAQTSVPYAIIGGILAVLVFAVICILTVMVWCSVRQKGSYLTHEASGLDEHGEAREAFLNGSEPHKKKEEFFI
ncbi:cell adhesion molecule 4 [Latimeria chalumnae]|uniref:cell adhesion molecule 4 n=1 Tax=Latimeria chalumnae TaxID=7897 RepID=UPI00313D08D6